MVLAALVLALAWAVVGCAGDEFEDRTALVAVDGAEVRYAVDACGRDGETVFVVARADDGSVVQAVLGLDADGEGDPASSGITVDADPGREDTRVAAFGPASWSRRDGPGVAPGTVTSAALRGSRIQLAGEVVAVDASDAAALDAEPVGFSFDARCDEQD